MVCVVAPDVGPWQPARLSVATEGVPRLVVNEIKQMKQRMKQGTVGKEMRQPIDADDDRRDVGENMINGEPLQMIEIMSCR
jgi:hypothetical protein